MKSINLFLSNEREKNPKMADGRESPNSPRGEQLLRLMTLMREDPNNRRRWAYWAGRTRHLSPGAIYILLERARYGTNQQALFNHLLNQTTTQQTE